MRRFEILLEGSVYVLYNIAWKAKRDGALDHYIEILLNQKDQHVRALVFLDAYFEYERGQSLNRFEKWICPLSKEQKREVWRRAYRERSSIERHLKLDDSKDPKAYE